MATRFKLSVILLILSAMLAVLPLSGKYTLRKDPNELLTEALDPETWLTPDQVAKSVVTEDSTIQLIDLRKKEDFSKTAIPGAINIPYSDFLVSDLESYLDRDVRTVFYSDDDYEANYALILAKGIGYGNCSVMKGGLEAWHKDIMNSEFQGTTISARENALFEIRFRARKLFSEINNMPDSLKVKYMALKEIERKKLDGGCE